MPALQSTNPSTCAWLKCAKALDTSCFHDDNRSWQDIGFLLADEAAIHFLIIIADASVLAFFPPLKNLYLKATRAPSPHPLHSDPYATHDGRRWRSRFA